MASTPGSLTRGIHRAIAGIIATNLADPAIARQSADYRSGYAQGLREALEAMVLDQVLRPTVPRVITLATRAGGTRLIPPLKGRVQ